jgi:hypothetical protein
MFIVCFIIQTAATASCIWPVVSTDTLSNGIYVLKQCEAYAPSICTRDTFSQAIFMNRVVTKGKNALVIAIARIENVIMMPDTALLEETKRDSVYIVIDSVIKGPVIAGWGSWFIKQYGCSNGYTPLVGQKFLLITGSIDNVSMSQALPDPAQGSSSASVSQKGYLLSSGIITNRTMPGISVTLRDFLARLSTGIVYRETVHRQTQLSISSLLKEHDAVLYTPDGKIVQYSSDNSRLNKGVYFLREIKNGTIKIHSVVVLE